jgi:8-oxo-dGTP diphosphatase
VIPRHGRPPEPFRSYVARPGIYAVLIRGRRVLLTFQDAPEREFQLPGGGIDPGEFPLRALHREVFEETGWRIAAPRRLGVFRRFVWMPDYRIHAEKICRIYAARPVLRIGPPTEPGHRAVWLPVRMAVAALGNDGDAAHLGREADRRNL